ESRKRRRLPSPSPSSLVTAEDQDEHPDSVSSSLVFTDGDNNKGNRKRRRSPSPSPSSSIIAEDKRPETVAVVPVEPIGTHSAPDEFESPQSPDPMDRSARLLPPIEKPAMKRAVTFREDDNFGSPTYSSRSSRSPRRRSPANRNSHSSSPGLLLPVDPNLQRQCCFCGRHYHEAKDCPFHKTVEERQKLRRKNKLCEQRLYPKGGTMCKKSDVHSLPCEICGKHYSNAAFCPSIVPLRPKESLQFLESPRY
ncbi:hypothetical protein PFISCL1PPCAC_12486, partial [Pristionchus fissidentatus]